MCCGGSRGPKWKREVVKDHKFDYIDVEEFVDPSCPARTGYYFMYFLMLKGFAVYIADLYTAVSLLVIGNSTINADASIPPDVSKWIFLGAIMISFLLLFWDIIKSRGIIESRDISLAFFSVIANRWYSTKDYSYYCLFRKINNSIKTIDTIAFFVFFTLKGWKKILLAEAPRQVINIVTLIAIIPNWIKINNGLILEQDGLGKNTMQRIMTGTMIFSVVVFAISFVLICIAAAIYIPLLCHIQGNLKEYCCHKVDKRIEEILKKQAQKRIKQNAKGYDNHSKKSKKQDIEMHSLPQPKLPVIDMDNLTKTGYNYGHQQQPSHSSQQNYYPHQRPGYYHQTSSSNASTVVGSHFGGGRRNSMSSVSSDQVGLTSHAQPQPWSSPYTGGGGNQQYQQYQQYQQQPSNYNYQQQQQYHQQHQNYY